MTEVGKVNSQLIHKSTSVRKIFKFGRCDAGGRQLGGSLFDQHSEVDKKHYQVSFSEEEMEKSSTYRELRGIEEGLLTLSAVGT